LFDLCQFHSEILPQEKKEKDKRGLNRWMMRKSIHLGTCGFCCLSSLMSKSRYINCLLAYGMYVFWFDIGFARLICVGNAIK